MPDTEAPGKHGARSSLGGEKGIWLLASCMAGAAFALYWGAVRSAAVLMSELQIPWGLVAAMFCLAEIFVIHIQFRRDAASFSLNEIPLVLGLFFVTPEGLVLAQLLGVGVALVLHSKQPPLKLFFNLTRSALEVCVAVLAFSSIVSFGDPLGPIGWSAAFVATLAVDLLSSCTIAIAIWLSEGRPESLPRLFGVGTATTFANTCLSLIAVTVLWDRPAAAWLLVVMAVVMFMAYRAYGSVRQKHESLELLYESTQVAQHSLHMESTLVGLLNQARDMFRADAAEVVLFASGEGEPALRTSIGPNGRSEVMRSVRLDPTQGVWARVAAEGQPILLARPIKNERLHDHFAAFGIKDAMVAPLRGKGATFGTMLVGNRLGDFSTFNEEDMQLFETLVNHASVALENGRLVDSLRQKAEENERLALHDVLTGLPNRALFQVAVRNALASAKRERSAIAVMLMDLDRFKEVNDTLGHHHGDLLLQQVARRLQEVLRESDIVARLGGDEFAILLPHLDDSLSSVEAAKKVLHALERPFEIQHLTLDVGGSIGIAIYPENGADADTLLKQADVAMYLAKESHSGYELYNYERDGYSPDRLGLVAELRSAIDEAGFHFMYQPMVDLRNGRVTGFEALVRWRHPRHGLVPPDEFIPIAEHTGMIKPLTTLVLNSALRQSGLWALDGSVHKVSVNISARSLLDVHFPEEIAAVLTRWNVPPSSLQLEITESSIMADPERSRETVSRLSDMGVSLSIDDFGTGYSSLSHLKGLPVKEVKIDKSFVMNMACDANDAAIVRSIIELGHNLGLQVVAEGVESRALLDSLVEWGCDLAQGFHLSRPLDPDHLMKWTTGWQLMPAADVFPAEVPEGVVPLRSRLADKV
jgi:diguanylate cyclase (GGDEF)-like protein